MLDYVYFNKNYELIVADLNKQKALGADARAIQQILFTGEVKKSQQSVTFLNNQKKQY